MPTNAQQARVQRPVADEVIAAAGAVFGVLELIAETDCTATTDKNVQIALHGADARLRELGLTRSDLAAPCDIESDAHSGWPSYGLSDRCAHLPNVIPLGRPRRSSQRPT